MPEFAPSFGSRKKVTQERVKDSLNIPKQIAVAAAEEESKRLGYAGGPFTQDVIHYGHQGAVMGEMAERLAHSIGGRVIGAGAERIVIEREDGKVLGIYRYPKREGGLEQKKRFYTFRVLHTLFPQFFPEVYAAGFSSSLPKGLELAAPLLQKAFPEYFLSYTVTEKIERPEYIRRRNVDGTITRLSQDGKVLQAGELELPERKGPDKEGEVAGGNYLTATNILKGIGIHLWTDDEMGKNNIREIYTDGTATLYPLSRAKGDWDAILSTRELEQVTHYMEEEKYSPHAISVVKNAFTRLIALQEQEKKE